MASKNVEIVVTNSVVAHYEARSYPDQQTDDAGYYPLYKVPVHRILVRGKNAAGAATSIEFMAPRFMPYFNDPARPDPHYGLQGWANAGLSSANRIKVSRYKQDYAVHNRYSPGRGAIVLRSTFYIHAGPATLSDWGFGSAGCIEIIGNYDDFKNAIAGLSGLSNVSSDSAIQALVAAGKLTVVIQGAKVPDIQNNLTRRVHD
jgi:hypothetical protein